MDKKIHVGLYGDGSRDAHLRRETIYCDRSDECSVYREGRCLRITSFLAQPCPFGRLDVFDGGTKRSMKYQRTYSETKADEFYGRLKRSHYTYFAIAGDSVIIGGMSVSFDTNPFKVNAPGFSGGRYMAIPKSEFSVDVIKKIYDARPYSLMGGVIESYRSEQLPLFFQQMRKLWPEKYEEFAAAVPAVRDLVPNYVGRWARVSTLNRDVPVEGYRFDGDELVGEFKSAFLPFGAKSAHIRIPVTDDLKVKITSNDQVTEDTVFE